MKFTFTRSEWITNEASWTIAQIEYALIAYSSTSTWVRSAWIDWLFTTSDRIRTSNVALHAGASMVTIDNVTVCVWTAWRWLANVSWWLALFVRRVADVLGQTEACWSTGNQSTTRVCSTERIIIAVFSLNNYK